MDDCQRLAKAPAAAGALRFITFRGFCRLVPGEFQLPRYLDLGPSEYQIIQTYPFGANSKPGLGLWSLLLSCGVGFCMWILPLLAALGAGMREGR